MSTRSQVFSSRWGMLVAMLGMAIGTGNIWRFPRIAASNGGGEFLVAWAVFLLMWSVPLLILEFGMAKATRRGTVGSFVKTLGPKFAWMGAWVAWVATAILFYYTVVMGWTIRFFIATLTGEIPSPSNAPTQFWDAFNSTPQAVLFHGLAIALGVFVVSKGVRGIEKAAKILIPSLVILVVVLAVKAVTLPGAGEGLAFLFTPDFSKLGDAKLWVEALTQNAWDTGAGWGLVLSYAIYMRSKEDTSLNAFVIGFGNNSMSLLAGIMVLCTIFSVMPEAHKEIVGAGNEGLTFIWVPQLFAQIPGGQFFMALFFLVLVFAAWSSLVAMIELSVRVLMDLGVARKRAIATIGTAGFLLGIPSALRIGFFQNQDWVWGVGLMLTGLFFAVAVLKYGVTKWRESFVDTPDSDVRVGRWWDWAVRLVVVEAVVLLGWWLWEAARGKDFAEAWTLMSSYNAGTVVIQFAVVLAVLLAANRWLARRALAASGDG